MALSASENPVIIAADATPQSRDIQIKWTDSIRAAIFEKHVGQSFKARDMTDPEQASQSYDVTITPGDVYTAVMYNESHTTTPDPNKSLTEPRPELILSVFGLADRRLELIADAKIESKGGTFVVFKVSTSAPTSALVQVGETVPVTDIVGLPSFEAPVVLEPEAASVGALTVHTLVATPLVPGRLYIAIILVSDKSGRWDFREIAFNTNKRRVSGTIDSIFIVNCGDPSIGEAQFWVDVHETGTSGADKVFRQFSLGNDEFNIINSQTIPLPRHRAACPGRLRLGRRKLRLRSTRRSISMSTALNMMAPGLTSALAPLLLQGYFNSRPGRARKQCRAKAKLSPRKIRPAARPPSNSASRSPGAWITSSVAGLSRELPGAADQLTPQGRLPSEQEAARDGLQPESGQAHIGAVARGRGERQPLRTLDDFLGDDWLTRSLCLVRTRTLKDSLAKELLSSGPAPRMDQR